VAKRHPNENLRTQFEGTGRFAGTGIVEDDYSEESYPDERRYWRRGVAFWHKPMKIEAGEVKTYKLTDEELEYYRNLEVERWIKWKNS
jgi:hypothetical protein